MSSYRGGSAIFAAALSSALTSWGLSEGNEASGFADRFLYPFEASMIALVLGCVYMAFFWKENRGARHVSAGPAVDSGVFSTLVRIARDPLLLLLMLVQSLFESAMYLFVCAWAPLLDSMSRKGDPMVLSHGTVFAIFMGSLMAGSALFKLLVHRLGMSVSRVAAMNALVATGCLVVAAAAPHVAVESLQYALTLFGFCTFELCVGCYFPSIGVLRAELVPNRVRASVTSIFRVPMNVIVVSVLFTESQNVVWALLQGDFSSEAAVRGSATEHAAIGISAGNKLLYSCLMLAASCAAQLLLNRMVSPGAVRKLHLSFGSPAPASKKVD